jgi:undecaprenyl-phosphate 4-deoxy-4-formamido-L-arabinose transferase
MRDEPRGSVVVQVFDEQQCLGELVERTLAACRRGGFGFELILVDDGSSDSSGELIRAAAARHPEVRGVLLNRNYGQHAAVTAGLAESRGEVVVTLDADLQNPPEEIPRLVAAALGGCDVVGTVRVPREDSLFRRAASAATNFVVQRSTGVRMHDYGCMLRAYRRPVVDAMLACRERSTFIPVLANRFASRTTEIEVAHRPRRAGQSKYGLLKLVRLQLDLVTSMTTFPLRVLSAAGAVLAGSGFALGLALVVARLAFGAAWAADGVFTLFAALFFFLGAQFVGLGLLGEYVGRIYDDVRARPRWFVREVVDGVEPVSSRPRPLPPPRIAAAGRGGEAG